MSSDNIPTDEEVDGYEDYIEECIDQQHRKEEELIEKYENELRREFFRDTLIINRAHVGWTPKEEPVEDKASKYNGKYVFKDDAFKAVFKMDIFKNAEYVDTSRIAENVVGVLRVLDKDKFVNKTKVGCTPQLANDRLPKIEGIKELLKDNCNRYKPRRWQLIEQ